MFKVGDKVRCVNNNNWSGCLTVGKCYTVLLVDSKDGWVTIVDDTNDRFEYDHSRFELVREEPMFKVGDKIRCIDNVGLSNCLTLGKVYTVLSMRSSERFPTIRFPTIEDDEGLHSEYVPSWFELCNTEITEQTEVDMILPKDSKVRKEIPLTTGLLDYFPRALAAVANASYQGNQQHHPDKPLHWDRSVSNDHADCILRHMVDRGKFDTDKIRHSAKLAWRALALLELELEQAEKENQDV